MLELNRTSPPGFSRIADGFYLYNAHIPTEDEKRIHAPFIPCSHDTWLRSASFDSSDFIYVLKNPENTGGYSYFDGDGVLCGMLCQREPDEGTSTHPNVQPEP
jgi:hypothetical protein